MWRPLWKTMSKSVVFMQSDVKKYTEWKDNPIYNTCFLFRYKEYIFVTYLLFYCVSLQLRRNWNSLLVRLHVVAREGRKRGNYPTYFVYLLDSIGKTAHFPWHYIFLDPQLAWRGFCLDSKKDIDFVCWIRRII